jgi:hypothetical protein
MNKERERKLYASFCKLNERNAVVWFRLPFWKLRGLTKGVERGRCSLCEEEENE